MQGRNTIQEYLDSVTAQIRWKRARPLVRQELAHHLEDQRAAFAAEGCENAEELAVKEIDEAGGINGVPIRFDWQDDEGDVE